MSVQSAWRRSNFSRSNANRMHYAFSCQLQLAEESHPPKRARSFIIPASDLRVGMTWNTSVRVVKTFVTTSVLEIAKVWLIQPTFHSNEVELSSSCHLGWVAIVTRPGMSFVPLCSIERHCYLLIRGQNAACRSLSGLFFVNLRKSIHSKWPQNIYALAQGRGPTTDLVRDE